MAPYNSQQDGNTFNSNTQNTSNDRNQENNRNSYNHNTQDNRNFQNNRFASLQGGNPTGYRGNGKDGQRENGRRDGRKDGKKGDNSKKSQYQKGDKSKRSDDQKNQTVEITFNTGKTTTVTIPNDNPNNKPKNGFSIYVEDGNTQKPKKSNYSKKDNKTEKRPDPETHHANIMADKSLKNKYEFPKQDEKANPDKKENTNEKEIPTNGNVKEFKLFQKPEDNQEFQIIDKFNNIPVIKGRNTNPFNEYMIVKTQTVNKQGQVVFTSQYAPVDRKPISIIRQINVNKIDKKTLQVEQKWEYDVFDVYGIGELSEMIIAIPPKNVVKRVNGKDEIITQNIITSADIIKKTPSVENNRYIASYIEDEYIKHILQQFARQSESSYIQGYSVFTVKHITYMRDFIMERSAMFRDFLQHIENLNGGTLPQLSFTIPKFQEIYNRSYVVSDRMFSIKVTFDDDYGTNRTYFFKADPITTTKKDKDGKQKVQISYSPTNFQIYQSVAFSRDMVQFYSFTNWKGEEIIKDSLSYTKVNRLRFIDFKAKEYEFDKMYVAVEKVEKTDKNGKIVYEDREIYQHDIANGTKNSFELRQVDYNDTLFSSVEDIKNVNKQYVEFLLTDKAYVCRLFIRYVLLKVEGLIYDKKTYTWNFFKYIPRQSKSQEIKGWGLTDNDIDRRIFDVSDYILIQKFNNNKELNETLSNFFQGFKDAVQEEIEKSNRYEVNYYSHIVMDQMKQFVEKKLKEEKYYTFIQNMFKNWDRTKKIDPKEMSAFATIQRGQLISIKDPYYPKQRRYQLFYVNPESLIGDTEVEKAYYKLFCHDGMVNGCIVKTYHMWLYGQLDIYAEEHDKTVEQCFLEIDTYKKLVKAFKDNLSFNMNIVQSKIYTYKQKQQLFYMIYWLTYIYINNKTWMDGLDNNKTLPNIELEKQFIRDITPWVRFYKMFIISMSVQNEYGGFQYFKYNSKKGVLPNNNAFYNVFSQLDEVQNSLDVNMLKYKIVKKDIHVYKDTTTNYDKITLEFQNEFILPLAVNQLQVKVGDTDDVNQFYSVSYTTYETIDLTVKVKEANSNRKSKYQEEDDNGKKYMKLFNDYGRVIAEYQMIFYNEDGSIKTLEQMNEMSKEARKHGYLKIDDEIRKFDICENSDGTESMRIEKQYVCQRYEHLRYIFGYSQMFDQFYKDATHGKYHGFLFDGIPKKILRRVRTTIQNMFNLSPRIKYNIFKNTVIGLDYKLKPEIKQQVEFEYNEETGTHNLSEFIDQYQPSDTYNKYCKNEKPNNNNSNKNDKQ